MMDVTGIKPLRRILLPILKRFATDIQMRHPYVPAVRMTLNSYKHKGYWFHRRRREEKTMLLFCELIQPGMQVVEVGGHIGFISIYFMDLVGAEGLVTVFEPGANNLPYIRKNLAAAGPHGVKYDLRELAVGDHVGKVVFYEDSLTGQNNSAIKDFAGLKVNAAAAFSSSETQEHVVAMTTLDEELSGHRVDFIKIDVEGFEAFVVKGSKRLIEEAHPMLMVEIQADAEWLYDFFTSMGYFLFLENREKVSEPGQLRVNVFALHQTAHAAVISKVFRHNPLMAKA